MTATADTKPKSQTKAKAKSAPTTAEKDPRALDYIPKPKRPEWEHRKMDPSTGRSRDILDFVKKNGPSTVPDLALHIYGNTAKSANLQSAYQRLLREGYLEVTSTDGPRKSKIYGLTKKGWAVMARSAIKKTSKKKTSKKKTSKKKTSSKTKVDSVAAGIIRDKGVLPARIEDVLEARVQRLEGTERPVPYESLTIHRLLEHTDNGTPKEAVLTAEARAAILRAGINPAEIPLKEGRFQLSAESILKLVAASMKTSEVSLAERAAITLRLI